MNEILAVLVGIPSFAALVGWLVKELVGKVLESQAAVHKQKLDQQTEQFKANLEYQARAHAENLKRESDRRRVVLERLLSDRSEASLELHRRLWRFCRSLVAFASPVQMLAPGETAQDNRISKYRACEERLYELFDAWDPNKILFDEQEEKAIDAVVDELWKHWVTQAVYFESTVHRGKGPFEYSEAREKAVESSRTALESECKDQLVSLNALLRDAVGSSEISALSARRDASATE